MCRFLLLVFAIPNLLFLVPTTSEAQSPEPKTAEARLFAFLDQNRNGVIDPAEFKNVPLPMRIWLVDNGIESTKPLPRAQFLKVAPKMMQAIRQGRHAGREKTPSRSVSLVTPPSRTSQVATSGKTASPSTSSSGSTGGARGSSSISSMLNLPSSYSDGDIDGDGQIGMYEWRKWKKSALSQFLKLDRNDDGFLTPRELQSASSGSSLSSGSSSTSSTVASSTTPASSSSGRRTRTSSSGRSPSSTTTTTAVAALPTISTDQHKTKAAELFIYIDTNKNGSIEPLELLLKGRSSAKPVLEKAKVDLSKPLTKDQFIAGYVKGKAASE